jgi:hypothetical protein
VLITLNTVGSVSERERRGRRGIGIDWQQIAGNSGNNLFGSIEQLNSCSRHFI